MSDPVKAWCLKGPYDTLFPSTVRATEEASWIAAREDVLSGCAWYLGARFPAFMPGYEMVRRAKNNDWHVIRVTVEDALKEAAK